MGSSSQNNHTGVDQDSVKKYIEAKKTIELRECLVPFNMFNSRVDTHQHMVVLESLQGLACQWIRYESLRKNMPPSISNNIYAFGSYKLGVHHRGSSIQALCVAPRHICRCDFFNSFYDLLEQQPLVRDLRPVVDAVVPTIKMNYDGIDIDLLFASLASDEIPDSLDFRDNILLKSMSRSCVRSLDGCRVTDEILRLVPNISNFRLTLRVIILWAKCHGIYSSTLGYLGDVSLAILVARTCQLYPNALPATLVHKFFFIFSQWMWPQPVLIKRLNTLDLGMKVWNPLVNFIDLFDLMPIITPVYPERNSAISVTASSRSIIMEEFRLGLETTNNIMNDDCGWERLFEAPNFFCRYNHFIVLLAAAACADDQLQWSELIENRIRPLISTLEKSHIMIAHVNPECYNSVPLNTNDGHPLALPPGSPAPADQAQGIIRNHEGDVVPNVCSMWFIGLVFDKTTMSEEHSVDLTQIISLFTKLALHRGDSAGVLRQGMTIEARHIRRSQLHQYLSPSLLPCDHTSSSSKRRAEASSAHTPHKKGKISESSMDDESKR